MSDDVSIAGLQAAQAGALQAFAALQPSGAFGRAIKHATAGAHRYATSITPVLTGSWRASQRPELNGLTGRVFLDPQAVNPASGTLPSIYGAQLEQTRGGRYAVYRQTVDAVGERLLAEAGDILIGALP